MNKSKTAFTLIELLIVVLIIAILAAIALPNFVEFQVRAKVARVHNDLRTLATALEAYCVDNGEYIPHIDSPDEWIPLTTPIAYISSILMDPFAEQRARNWDFGYVAMIYHMEPLPPPWGSTLPGGILGNQLFDRGQVWLIWSVGPDLEHNMHICGAYDPTNGSVSLGDIYRSGP